MNIRELPTIEESTWDGLVLHPLQSYKWGTIREKTGVKVVRFGCYEKEILKDVYQMTLHKIPYINYFIGYVPRSQMPSGIFLEYLYEYCKKYKIIFVTFEPEGRIGTELPKKLVRSAHPLFYEWTRIINISKSIDQLKKELESGTRYNIGLAERKGVKVLEEKGDEAFNVFYNLFNSTTKRQNFGGHTMKYHKTIWDIFSQNGTAHILVARYEGRPLAACELFLYKNVLYYTYAGSSNEDRNVKAMNALMWGVIEFGKKYEAHTVDLWGIAPPNNSSSKNSWVGFTDFKNGYGGEAVQMCGSYDLIVFTFLYKFYSIINTFRKYISRLKG